MGKHKGAAARSMSGALSDSPPINVVERLRARIDSDRPPIGSLVANEHSLTFIFLRRCRRMASIEDGKVKGSSNRSYDLNLSRHPAHYIFRHRGTFRSSSQFIGLGIRWPFSPRFGLAVQSAEGVLSSSAPSVRSHRIKLGSPA
jgi:hypothetical protein